MSTTGCAIAGCAEQGSAHCSVGFARADGWPVDYDVAYWLCDQHVAVARSLKPWSLTLDYAKIDLPAELAALAPEVPK